MVPYNLKSSICSQHAQPKSASCTFGLIFGIISAMTETIDRPALVSQKVEAERLANLLKSFNDEERKSDVWISILEGYFVGRTEVADLIVNKSRVDVAAYLHNVLIEAGSASKLADGIEELWRIIQDQFKSPHLFPVFNLLIPKWRRGKKEAEAKFLGAWDLVSEFKVLDTTYSFLSPENNGIKGAHLIEVRNRAASAPARYRY